MKTLNWNIMYNHRGLKQANSIANQPSTVVLKLNGRHRNRCASLFRVDVLSGEDTGVFKYNVFREANHNYR